MKIALIVLTALVSVTVTAPAGAEVRETCAVAAHRGDWSAAHTENGLPAIRSAITGGADYVETDLRLTRDERFVLMHDATVARTTDGIGRVANKPLRKINALRLDDGTRVPTLEQLLATGRGNSVHMLIELKAMGDMSTFRDVKAQVNAFGNKRVRIISRSTLWLDTLERIAPAIPKGIVTDDLLTNEQIAPYDSVMLNFTRMTTEWLDQVVHPVYAWTLNDEEKWNASHARRLAAVITDAPWDFMTWREVGCADETTVSP